MKTEYRLIHEDSQSNFESQINDLAEKGFSPVGSHQHFKDDGYSYYSILMEKKEEVEQVRSWIHVPPTWTKLTEVMCVPNRRLLVKTKDGHVGISTLLYDDTKRYWRDDDGKTFDFETVVEWMNLPE
jgi:hypothetical protein